MCKFIHYFILITILASCTLRNPDIIVTNKSIQSVDDRLFGHFLEKSSWDGEIGGDLLVDVETKKPVSEVFDLMKSMNIPVLRYPGGTDADYYPWYNLVENVPFRNQKNMPPYKNRNTKKVVSDNRLGLDLFIEICRELDAEPILVVNIGDAFYKKKSIDSAARVAAGLVAYCNATQESVPDHLKFWN